MNFILKLPLPEDGEDDAMRTARELPSVLRSVEALKANHILPKCVPRALIREFKVSEISHTCSCLIIDFRFLILDFRFLISP